MPNRDWIGNETIGHAYSQRFGSAEEVAALAESSAWLAAALENAAALQSLYFNNTLFPAWLQDGLVNSASLGFLYRIRVLRDD